MKGKRVISKIEVLIYGRNVVGNNTLNKRMINSNGALSELKLQWKCTIIN